MAVAFQRGGSLFAGGLFYTKGEWEVEYPSFTNTEFGSETIIMNKGEYVLLNMVDKTSVPLGKTTEAAKQKLVAINKGQFAC
ncbi:hypothetical protein [Sporomusa termitida]|uniref:Uncharacterized protein n=1 Tax=Sporomusa termitida TaxID=2377 RepID=A0A517DWF3_9FIRM|nr:hypothetical protein [Sporomusa termitida]QDR81682.1 hypothetical protein SPTER_30940 [Sporomusa termitida]